MAMKKDLMTVLLAATTTAAAATAAAVTYNDHSNDENGNVFLSQSCWTYACRSVLLFVSFCDLLADLEGQKVIVREDAHV